MNLMERASIRDFSGECLVCSSLQIYGMKVDLGISICICIPSSYVAFIVCFKLWSAEGVSEKGWFR